MAKGATGLLLKVAYTGIAASLIDGKTLHLIGHISVGSNKSGTVKMSKQVKQKLQEFWKSYMYLIIDECSMVSKSFLAKLSHHIGIAKQCPGEDNKCDDSFGSINIIFGGDFHQFPPVAKGKREGLYYPVDLARDSHESQIGRAIYKEFMTVVILREQMCVKDPDWRDFLDHL